MISSCYYSANAVSILPRSEEGSHPAAHTRPQSPLPNKISARHSSLVFSTCLEQSSPTA